MNLCTSDLAVSVLARLPTGFQRDVFNAALQCFDDENNPLRLNNFATALRELGRIHLEHSAPDGKVNACDWFEQKFNELKKPIIERAQRAKYAIQGELHDDFVTEVLGIEVKDAISEYTKLISRLSSFTHVTEKTFNVPKEAAEKQAIEALEIFDQLFRLIEERHEALRRSAADKAKDALQDELMSEVNEELDRLATHYYVQGVNLYELEIVSLDPDTIKYAGSGDVDCRFQYGSDSDVERDDGLVTNNSYPLTCTFVADTSLPLEISIAAGTLNVNTDRFYETGEEEDVS